jgi:hypothetical protein
MIHLSWLLGSTERKGVGILQGIYPYVSYLEVPGYCNSILKGLREGSDGNTAL